MLELDLRKTINGFSLEVAAQAQARVLGIVGPSGSGKTTLLHCIAGLIQPDSGTIIVNGRTLVDTAAGKTAIPVRDRRVGYVLQDSLLFPHMSVEANLRYGLRKHESGPRLHDVVDVLELGPLLPRSADTLSGGQARRVAVGRALLSAPRLLLLDEPLTGLDRRLAGKTLHYLHRVLTAFDIPAIYVSHTMSDVLFLCQEVWLLSSGRMVAAGVPRHVLSSSQRVGDAPLHELENVFLAAPDRTASPEVTAFRVGTQRLIVASPIAPATHEALLAIRASDIMLSLTRPERISARNVLRGQVAQVANQGKHSLVFVDVGVEWIVAITPGAVEELNLRPGIEVFCILKASSISVIPTSGGSSIMMNRIPGTLHV